MNDLTRMSRSDGLFITYYWILPEDLWKTRTPYNTRCFRYLYFA